MDGPTHYSEAEIALEVASNSTDAPDSVAWLVGKAQVHATLALAAAVAELTAKRYAAGMATGRSDEAAEAWNGVFTA